MTIRRGLAVVPELIIILKYRRCETTKNEFAHEIAHKPEAIVQTPRFQTQASPLARMRVL